MSLQKITTLEDIVRYASMEPQQGLRLWIDMLRVLAEKHEEGIFFGTLNPRAVLIDMKNAIVLVDSPAKPDSPYAAPEVLQGAPPDDQSDIYSMGVMLFEMLTGSLEGLHHTAPSRAAEGVPRWIDPIALRCIMKQRSRRFLDLEEISQALGKVKTNIQALNETP